MTHAAGLRSDRTLLEARFTSIRSGTIIGVAQRILRRPHRYQSAQILPSMNAMDEVIGAPYFTDPRAVGLHHRPREAGTSLPALQSKASALLRQQFATLKTFTDHVRKRFSPHPCGATPRRRHPEHAGRLQGQLKRCNGLPRGPLVACANIATATGARMAAARNFRARALGAAQPNCAPAPDEAFFCRYRLLLASPSYLGAHACWRSPF